MQHERGKQVRHAVHLAEQERQLRIREVVAFCEVRSTGKIYDVTFSKDLTSLELGPNSLGRRPQTSGQGSTFLPMRLAHFQCKPETRGGWVGRTAERKPKTPQGGWVAWGQGPNTPRTDPRARHGVKAGAAANFP
jgi:hypothetical protein